MTTVTFQRKSPSAEQIKAEQWIAENEAKLRQYARALARRDTGSFFEEGDFYQTMCMKVFVQTGVSPKFIEMGNAYIFKAVWNEGLIMLRKQQRYTMNVVNIKQVLESGDGDEVDHLPANYDSDPENQYHVSATNELLQAAIASLPLQSQRVCTMLYAGKRPVEIAKEMGFGSRATINYHIEKIRSVFMAFGLQAV